MQITLTTIDGEVIVLPKALALDDADLKFHDVPSMVIPGRHGRRVVGERCRRDQRTIRLSGVVRDVDRATLDATVSDLNGKLCRGELQLRKNAGDDRYLKVRTTGIQVNYHRGHFGGRVATISCTLVADDPFWYGAEQTVEHIISGTPGEVIRVEAEAPGSHKVTLGNTVDGVPMWTVVSWATASAGRYLRTTKINDYIQVEFYGSGISVWAVGGTSRRCDIYVDDTLVVSNYNGFSNTEPSAYHISNLTTGVHTLKVVNKTEPTFYVDAFDILPSAVLEINNPGTADADPEIYLEAVEREDSSDFLGKTKGVVTANKHVARVDEGTTLPASPAQGTEVETADYAALATKDGTLHSHMADKDGEYPMMGAEINLSHLAGGDIDKIRQHTTSLDLEAYTYGEGMNGTAKDWQSEIALWNHNTSQWVSQGYAGMQFSRASAAYNPETGEEVPTNQPRFVRGYHHNLLTENQSNGGEDGTTEGFTRVGAPTTIESSTEQAWQGSRSIKVTTANDKPHEGIMVECPIKIGSTYTFSVWAKGSGNVQLLFSEAGSGEATLGSVVQLTDTWQRLTVTRTITTYTTAYLYIRTSSQQAAIFYVDGFQFEEGSTAKAWLPGGTGRAILVEEGTTNLIPLEKQKFEGWTAYYGASVTLTQNQIVPEWGALDATRIQITGGTGQYKYVLSIPAGGHTCSMWVKNIGDKQVRITNSNGVGVSVNPGESFRVAFLNNTSTIDIRTNKINDTLDFIAWRPMVEAKAYATRWTPDTRADESLTIPEPVRNGILNEAEGEISIWAYEDGRNKTAYLIDTNEASGRMFLARNSTKTYTVRFNNQNAFTTEALAVGWHLYKLVWKGSYVALFVDGVIKGSSTLASPVVFAGITKMYVGDFSGSTIDYEWSSIIDSMIFKSATQADAAAIEAAAAAEYVTYSQQPFEADANTTYLQLFNDDLAGIMPFRKTVANPAKYITEDADGQPRVHMLIKSRYPSDGVERAAVYVDYVRLGSKIAYAANPKITRITRNLAVDGDFSQGGYWGNHDATKRKYGLTPLGLGWYMRATNEWSIYQDFYLIPGQSYSFGCHVRHSVGVGNGAAPRIFVSFLRYANAAFRDVYVTGTDSATWVWLTNTFTVPAGTNKVRIYFKTSVGPSYITQNACDFAGFVLVPGSIPPGPITSPLAFPTRKTSTLQVTAELDSDDIIYAASNIDYRSVQKNGTRINGSVSPQFLVEGMQLKPGVNTFQLESAAGSGLWKATMRYSPRYD